MNPFPFIGGSYAARSPAFDAQRTVNLYPETSGSGNSKSVAMLVGTPGLVFWATLPTFPIRGFLRVSASLALVAAGAVLYSVTTAGAFTPIGAIAPGLTPVSMASDGVYVMIVTGLQGYFLVLSTMALSLIVNAAFVGADVVDFLDGFFVFNTPNTKEFQITGLYAETIAALDFASSEALPDTLLTLIVDHDELWLFSSAHTEVWSNVGAALFPFQRIQGAVIEQGCAAKHSVCKLDNTVVWLTADDRGQGTVQKAVGYTPQRISNHALEYAIASYPRIDDAVGYSYQQEGHLFYMLTFPTGKATWCFDTATELWHERAWRDPVSGQLSQHRSICHMAYAGLNIVGDYQNGNLYSLDLDTYTDYGNILPAIRQCPHIAQGNVWQFFSKLWIDMQMGVGTEGAPNAPFTAQYTVTAAASGNSIGYAAGYGSVVTNYDSQTWGNPVTMQVVNGRQPYFYWATVIRPYDYVTLTSDAGTVTLSLAASGTTFNAAGGIMGNTFYPVSAVPWTAGRTYIVTFYPAPVDPSLILDWSDDGGQSFGSQLTVSLGKIGERRARAIFRRLGKSRDRVFRATITDPVKRIFIGAGCDFTVGS